MEYNGPYTIQEFQKKFDKYFKGIINKDSFFKKYNDHHFSSKGKYIRPYLVYLGAEENNNLLDKIFDIGVVVELIHNYSLIHDDLKCMDNDIFRRGKKTIHVEFGEAEAVLYGDYLLTKAMTFALSQDIPKYAIYEIFGSAMEMLEGQFRDIVKEKKDYNTYESIYRQKTGSLFEAAYYSGYMLAKRNDEKTYEYIQRLGVYFQMLNDYTNDTSENTMREDGEEEFIIDLKIKKRDLICECEDNLLSRGYYRLVEYMYEQAVGKDKQL